MWESHENEKETDEGGKLKINIMLPENVGQEEEANALILPLTVAI